MPGWCWWRWWWRCRLWCERRLFPLDGTWTPTYIVWARWPTSWIIVRRYL
jgi:hypothetical protein